MKVRLKTVARRVLPASWVARYRLHQQSKHVRSNVDLFVDDLATARRWLAVTPDTYRARLTLPGGEPTSDITAVSSGDGSVDHLLRSKAMSAMSDPDLGAVVVAETAPPRIRGRYRSEPEVGPRLIVVRSSHLEEVGGVPDGDAPLPELLALLRAAGIRIGMIPIPVADAPVQPQRTIERDVVVILGMVPMHDVGGGSRSSQLALEGLRQGFHVLLVHLFQADESVDLGLRFVHPNFEQVSYDSFDTETLNRRVARPGLVLVEAPPKELKEAALSLQDLGWEVVYDVIDDWTDPALGGIWFVPDEERELVGRADRIIASAPDLLERVRMMRRPATLVPNAVNRDIFDVDLPPRPLDLPEVPVILGYHGSLYGDWFDWESLDEVAKAFPNAAVVVIGDDKIPRIELPRNVHFLGLKAQVDLPAYLQRFDVGLIPFKVSPTTHAVSPLKIFEYLASGVPVAAPPLRAIAGLEGVFTDYDLRPAVERALRATPPDRQSVFESHSWSQRIDAIFPKESRSALTQPSSPARVLTRATRHWSKTERLVP